MAKKQNSVARNAFRVEDINPAEYGIVRMKSRNERRHGMPREAWRPFLAKRAAAISVAQARWAWDAIKLMRMSRRATRAHELAAQVDPTMIGDSTPEMEALPERLAG